MEPGWRRVRACSLPVLHRNEDEGLHDLPALQARGPRLPHSESRKQRKSCSQSSAEKGLGEGRGRGRARQKGERAA